MPRLKKRLKRADSDDENEEPGSEEEDLYGSDADEEDSKKKKKAAAKKKKAAAKKKKKKIADSDEEEGAVSSDSDAAAEEEGDDGDAPAKGSDSDDDTPLAAKKKGADDSDDDTPLAKTIAAQLGPRPDYGPENKGKTAAERKDFAKLNEREQEMKLYERSEAIKAWDDRHRAIQEEEQAKQSRAAAAAAADKPGRKAKAKSKKQIASDEMRKRKAKSFAEDGEMTDEDGAGGAGDAGEEEDSGDDYADGESGAKRKRGSTGAAGKRAKSAAEAKEEEEFRDADSDDESLSAKAKAKAKAAAASAMGAGASAAVKLEDLKTVQLKRGALERLVDEPFFADFVNRKFVRINIGADENRVAKYRVAEVIKVTENGRPYAINQDPRFAHKKTTKRLMCVGDGTEKSAREFPMSMVSNQSITQPEFDKWLAALKAANKEPPSIRDVLELRRSARKLQENFVYTPQQVQAMLKTAKIRNFSSEMTKLKSAREDAKAREDEKLYQELTRKIEQLDELELQQMRRRIAAEGATAASAAAAAEAPTPSIVPATAATPGVGERAKIGGGATGASGILDINRRHQMENWTQIDKANAKVQKQHHKSEQQSGKREDPFKRRLTRPAQIYVDAAAMAPATPKGGAAAAKPAAGKPLAAAAAAKGKDAKGKAKTAAHADDDVVIGDHDHDSQSQSLSQSQSQSGSQPMEDDSGSARPAAAAAAPHVAALMSAAEVDGAVMARLRKNPVFAKLSRAHESVKLALDLNATKPKLPARLLASAQAIAHTQSLPSEYQKSLTLADYFKRREEQEAQQQA